ncbi:cyclopropane-fatty-acyl-phospholipid synthase family protein [Asticcacaulis sp. AC402]|uniref:SAM-dependent methyltransferase n=1 Tax=Asticcacaulis sp. AC402 TaxID=1282361 RepID=UPI0003C3DAB9|nr:cyclopropane-fatty-acyl-phospholipid synthase family protein [Asticcacaulis sp. AC402]ESQ73763.1 cyclopropane-fatty-acyl-phospholipid synthase [Asticcacaulis sp. AC402]
MSLLAAAAERAPIPDAITLATIDWLVGQTRRQLGREAMGEDAFAAAMSDYAIAEHTADANSQHYELPPEFFALILGARRKYSCCYYPSDSTTLDDAEENALAQTCDHADLHDGQDVLELGCGWGSLSLYMAQKYPGSRFTAVSNSHSQRQFILSEANRLGVKNLNVVTADMNDFASQDRFDRIVSVEMFEHMSNWQALLARARSWLNDDGRLFLHVFTHRKHSYRFRNDGSDWIGKYFFTGGIMPAQDLPHRFPDLFEVENEWRWSGDHYRRTAMDWLDNFDAEQGRILPILRAVYGRQAGLWRRRWRLFFLATAGLWGHAGGAEWGVGHYRLKAVS